MIDIRFEEEGSIKPPAPEAPQQQPAGSTARPYIQSDADLRQQAQGRQEQYQAEQSQFKAEQGPREYEWTFSKLADKALNLIRSLEPGQSQEVFAGLSSVKIGISTKHVKTYELNIVHPDPYLATDTAKELSQELDRFCENPFI